MGIVGLLAALILPGPAALPAHAQAESSAVCKIVIPAQLVPGFTTTSGTGTYGTAGEAGSITCAGTIEGHRVTGSGSFGFHGTYIGDCFGNVGSGTYSFTVPTDGGPVRIAGTYTETRTGLTGPVQASHPRGGFRGRFAVVPSKGDCFTTPLTGVLINIAGAFGP
jgi:hypothetical protein